jgi:AraC-like DNA-binding protein
MPDRLSAFLQRFALHARVFHQGPLCGAADFGETDGGHLHIVRRGPVRVQGPAGESIEVHEPSVLFYPRGVSHRLVADSRDGALVVCAAVDLGAGDENPLLRALPPRLVVALADVPAIDAAQALLFDEALGGRCGRAAVVDRLAEVLVVQLLRLAIERRLVDGGLLAGLADPRLAKALTAVHSEPGRAWTLEAMAEAAGMSRSRFAAHFTRVMGLPAGEYLVQWRIGVAKSLLRRGRPVKQVAIDVGYGASSTFGRAFTQAVGLTPTRWAQQAQPGGTA